MWHCGRLCAPHHILVIFVCLYSWNNLYHYTELDVTVRADTLAPEEDPKELGPNEFRAGSALSLNCVVQGNSGDLIYAWSVMGNPPTPGCTGCSSASSTTSKLMMGRSLNSYRSGVYTCTVSESGRPDSDNSDDFTVRVVGKRVCILCTVLSIITCWNNHPGAGIIGGGRTPFSESEYRPISNNGLLVSASDGLLLDCVSNSSQYGVGMITGLDGNTLPIGDTGVWRVVNPFSRPGVLRIHSTSITTADQGIYTCTIPDSNDNQFIFNFGLYSSGFMSE